MLRDDPGPQPAGAAPAETLADSGLSQRPRVQRRFVRGDAIGRFVVLDQLGAGGMGVVYAAYDPELDRKLAVKLLRGAEDDPEGRARLLREAQAMARLNHPNVCVVHDVGTVAGQVYVAMEFVEGETLKHWLACESRSPSEIIACFVEAGRGLAVAHAAGVVHRDFKPDNVMVSPGRSRSGSGRFGRVRVLDFGLARAADAEPDESPRIPSPSTPLEDHLSTPITRTGSIAGTPAYMAPEQHMCLQVGAPADQFSFCVSLYEALYGQRPFAGATIHELALAISNGEVRDPPPGTHVPTWLRKVIVRGLDADPEARWPTMDALLDALVRDPRARVRKGAVVGVSLAAVGGLGWAAFASMHDDPCADAGTRASMVWSDARRAAGHDAFDATGLDYATDAWTRVEQRLDAYARTWETARKDACEATHVRHEQSADLLDLRMACLDRGLTELDALVEVFASADASVVEKAAGAVGELRPIDRCADTNALRARLPPPADPDAAQAVAEIRVRIDRAAALQFSGKVDQALQVLREIAEDTATMGYEPLQAEVTLALGSALDSAGDYPAAEQHLREALWSALAVQHDDLAVEAATQLVHVVGYQLSRHDDALTWGRQAQALVRRTGGAWDREAELLSVMGMVYEDAARFDESREHHERALAIREEHLGPDALDVARTLNNLGAVLQSQGEFEDAHRYNVRALEVAEKALGPEHPQLRPILNNIGIVLDDLGDYAGAIEAYRRALAVSEATLGPDHPGRAGLLTNLGVSLLNLGRYDEALHYQQQALAAWERSVGPKHAHVASTLNNMATAHIRLDQPELARDRLQRAIEVWTDIYGPDHPSIADALVNLSGALIELDELQEARTRLERALRIYENAKGPDHPILAFPLSQLATVATTMGRHAQAVVLLERAATVAEHGDPNAEARVRFDLARALVRAHADTTRSKAQAERARELWSSAGETAGDHVAEVDDWLAALDEG